MRGQKRQISIPALRAQSSLVGSDAVQALITQASESKGTAKPPQVIFKALKKKTGVKSLSFEYKRKAGIDANTQFDIDLVSHPLRVDCKAGMLMLDSMDGSDEATAEDIAKFVKEQQTAKGKFPGPVPVVWRKNMQTVEDVALAKAIGCSGVTLVADQLDDQQMAQLVQACHALKMEALVEVTDKEQIERALAAGAQCLNVRFSSEAVASFLTFATKALEPDLVKATSTANVACVATVAARQGGDELSQAQAILALKGFHGVLFSGAVFDASQKDNIPYLRYLTDVLTNKRSTKIVINEKKATDGGYNRGAVQGWGDDSTTHV